VAGRREILLDCAHNGGGAEALSRYLEDEKIHAVHWVVGIKGDKDVEAIFNPLLGRVKMFYCCAVSQEPLIPPARLAAKAMAMGLKSQSFTGLEEALVAARRTRRKNEIVLVAGSIFVVGAAMNVLGKREASG
jgi:dihydrofolate synthase/folylpolyglutamate synthase